MGAGRVPRTFLVRLGGSTGAPGAHPGAHPGQNSKSMPLGGFYHPSYDKNFAVIRTDIRGTGPLGNHTLDHEYTHAYFRYNFRGLPLWLDEGLAEYYGNTSIESKEAGVGMPNETQLRALLHGAQAFHGGRRLGSGGLFAAQQSSARGT